MFIILEKLYLPMAMLEQIKRKYLILITDEIMDDERLITCLDKNV